MADRTSKLVLKYEVQNETAAVASVGRVQAAQNNLKKTTEQLHDAFVEMTGNQVANRLGKDFGVLAQDVGIAEDAVQELEKSLTNIGATKSQIKDAATEFEKFRNMQAEMPSFSDDELGAGGGKGGISRLGSKIRSLPSTQIPGTGLATDAIGNILRVVGAIPPAALPAIAALAAFGVALKVVSDNTPDVTAGIRDVTALDKTYYEARIKGTKDSIAAIVQQKELEQKIAQARVDDLEFVKQGYDILYEKTGLIAPGLAAITEVAGALGAKNFKDIRDARIAYDQAQEELKKANKELDLYNGLITDQGVALNTTVEELKKFNAEIADQTIHSIKERADGLQEIDKLVAEGSEKELEAKKKQLEATRHNAELQLADLKINIDYAKKGSDEQKKYQAEFARQNQIYNDATYELGLLGQASVDAAVKLNDANKELQKNRDDSADLIIKYNDDVTKADEAARKAQADAADKYNEALVKAADVAAKAAENALQKLNDQAEKLATSFQRSNEAAERKRQQNILENAIKFQQADAKAARDHADELLKIKQEEQNKEQDLIASRDFAGLFRARRDTTTKLQEANTQYQQEQQDRLTAYQQKNEDDQRQYEFEAKERQIKYQQSLTDAQSQYNKELAQAAAAHRASETAALIARNTQLQIAQSKYNAELQMLQGHIQRSLGLYAQGLSAEEQLQQARTAALLQQASLLRGSFGNPAVSFSGLGSTTNNNGGNSVNNTFNIRGNNPQGIATLVETQVNKSLRTYLVN